jgi:hypothetical protein
MISIHCEVYTFQLAPSHTESMHNCKHFLLRNVVIQLCRNPLPGLDKSHKMTFLQQHGTKTYIKSIRHDFVWKPFIRSTKQRSFDQLLLRQLKSISATTGPIPGNCLPCQVCQRHCYFRVVLMNFPELIDQTQKKTNIVHILMNWPNPYGLNFLGIGTNALSINNMFQVLNLLLRETGLGFTHVKLFTLKHIQNKTHVHLMLSFCLGENQDVIDIDNDKFFDVG